MNKDIKRSKLPAVLKVAKYNGHRWRYIDKLKRYIISDHGEIYDYWEEKIVEQTIDKDGYLQAELYIDDETAKQIG